MSDECAGTWTLSSTCAGTWSTSAQQIARARASCVLQGQGAQGSPSLRAVPDLLGGDAPMHRCTNASVHPISVVLHHPFLPNSLLRPMQQRGDASPYITGFEAKVSTFLRAHALKTRYRRLYGRAITRPTRCVYSKTVLLYDSNGMEKMGRGSVVAWSRCPSRHAVWVPGLV